MTLSIVVTPRTEDWLERRAKALALDKSSAAAQFLQEAADRELAATTGLASVQAGERLQELRRWVANVPARPGTPVDTSRESIYD
jgi:hypothetical protein